MVEVMAMVSGVFLGPFVVAYIYNRIQIKRLEKEERRLRLMDKYNLSESDLTMNVKR